MAVIREAEGGAALGNAAVPQRQPGMVAESTGAAGSGGSGRPLRFGDLTAEEDVVARRLLSSVFPEGVEV
jgi:hypothetical protein